MEKFDRIEAGKYSINFRERFKGFITHSNLLSNSENTKNSGWVAVIVDGDANEVYKMTDFKSLRHAKMAVMIAADSIKIEVTNLMSGLKTQESITTPYYCSVSSEAYWSN